MPNGLPGFHGMDHVGLTVPDLDEAIGFFCAVIGCELIYRAPSFVDETGSFMKEQLNVHPKAQIRGVAFLRCGNTTNFELFEFDSPDQSIEIPRNSNPGGHHLAFYVDDMASAIRHLESHNVTLLGKPVVESEGVDVGVTWQYFLAPWGLQLEVLSYPGGKAYEAETTARLWDPRNLAHFGD